MTDKAKNNVLPGFYSSFNGDSVCLSPTGLPNEFIIDEFIKGKTTVGDVTTVSERLIYLGQLQICPISPNTPPITNLSDSQETKELICLR